jgi:methyltransferase family protein
VKSAKELLRKFIPHPVRLLAGSLISSRRYINVPLDYPEICQEQPTRLPFDAVDDLFRKDLCRMQSFLETLKPYFAELDDVPQSKMDEISPYWGNSFFTGDDARVAYAMVREFKPRTIVEIGSGNSTKFLRKAIARGKSETRLISIDPFPRTEIDSLCDEVVRKSVVTMPPDFFDRLGPGDILFIDGSHIVFQGTDGPYLFLRVLPRIRPGVIVHIHDIFLPDDYPANFQDRWYNEQYLLAAMLLGNSGWTVLAAVAYLNKMGLLQNEGVSFWMEQR